MSQKREDEAMLMITLQLPRAAVYIEDARIHMHLMLDWMMCRFDLDAGKMLPGENRILFYNAILI